MFDYKLLEALSAVARLGSFDHAARELGLTQSAISQRVKLLEQRLGRPLLVRAHPIRPTQAGLALMRHQQQVAMMESTLSTTLVDEQESAYSTIRLAVNADSLATWLPTALAHLFEHHGVLSELTVEDEVVTLERLRRGEVAGCISAHARAVQGCRSTLLGALGYQLVATPRFIDRHFTNGICSQTLMQAPTLLFGRDDELLTRFLSRHFGDANGRPPHHQLPSSQGFLDAVLQHMGYALLPQPQVQEALAQGQLQALSDHRIQVPLYWHSWRLQSPVMETVGHTLIQHGKSALIKPNS
ncbi:LysR family transcriptional regulator, chromosome initiation inhibitor [Ferrimonas sediminum]|uniref:LysR family transcriptional regulator, chromosome initiation inhibitor n=1 Tax=Ferrimonas sediminum TaxID=718193 RepID=A0A1G8JVW9_9GAMM|nr:LysR family transcriptional regulator ArgP [Ferrimonas sediminum]SDI35372.1 LysR family transcriptional regulator, chromosome initiation inhibitor [Ferrimonas sediminum]